MRCGAGVSLATRAAPRTPMDFGSFESTFLLPTGAWFVGRIVRYGTPRTVAICTYEPSVGVGDAIVQHTGASCGSCLAQSPCDGTFLVCFGVDHQLCLHRAGARVGDAPETVVVGTAAPGFRDGAVDDAAFYLPYSAAATYDGGFVVTDTGNNALRMVSRAGAVQTLAGGEGRGFLDGTGTAARFNGPQGVATLRSGDLIVADTRNNALRLVTLQGVVTTLPHALSLPQGVAVDADGAVFVADSGNARLCRLSPDLACLHAVPLPSGVVPTRVSVDCFGQALVEGDDNVLHVVSVAPSVAATLRHEYAELLEESTFADVTLVAGQQAIRAHRCILAARCPYFRALFASSMHAGDGDVAVDGVTPAALHAVLAFIYAGTVPACEGPFLREVLCAADVLLLDGLLRACHAMLPGVLTHSNAVDWLLWAHECGTERARHLVEIYVARHLAGIHRHAPAEFGRLLFAPRGALMHIMRLCAMQAASTNAV